MSDGQLALGKGRFEAFSDGVFAIAITLLVLGFQAPEMRPATDDSIRLALLALWPQYLVYVASFATIGIMWINHHALFSTLKVVPHSIIVTNLTLLMLISFLPFPTSVLGRFGLTRTPVIYYGLSLIAISLCFNMLQYLVGLTPGERAGVIDFVKRRNLWNTIGVGTYAAGIPLAFYSPVASIMLYAAVAVFYLLPLGIRSAGKAAIIVIAFFFIAPSAAQARPFALDDQKLLVDIQEPQISPDGAAIAVVIIRPNFGADTYETTLELVDVATHSRRALTHRRDGIGFPRWSPDGRRIAYIAQTGGSDSSAQVFALPLDGGDSKQITSAPNDVQQIAWSPDSKAIAYVTADEATNRSAMAKGDDAFTVGNNDYLQTAAATPNHIWLAASDGSWHKRLTSGPKGLPSMNATYATASAIHWSPDGTYIAFARLPSAVEDDEYLEEIMLANASSGAVHKLSAGVYQMMPSFSPDGAQTLFAYPRGGDYNQGNEIFSAPTMGGPARALTAGLDRNAIIAKWMPDGENVLVGANIGTASALWLQPSHGGSPKRLGLGDVNWVNDNDWEPVTVGRSGAIAFTGSTGSDPTELYYMASASAAPVKLTHLNDAVAALDLGKSVNFDWRGPDGFAEDGVLTYPPGFVAGRKYPLAIYIHGGPIWAASLSFNELTQLLASAGFVVLQPNYRGSDNLGNAYERAIAPDAGAGPGRDIMAGIAAVEKLGNIDGSRIGVSGWSYGGYMTSWMISHYSIWKAAVSGAAVDDWALDYSIADDHKGDELQLRSTPQSDPARYRAVSPLTYAKAVTAPTLIMCDTGDPRVPIAESYEFYHALKDNHIPVTFVAYPVSGHLPPDPIRNADIDRRWVAWLKDHV